MLKVKTIKQNISFDASPEELYYLFMDPYKHAAFTGSDVIISNEINGKFNIFNGYCKGYNIELAIAQKLFKPGILQKMVGQKTIIPFANLALNPMEIRQN